MWDEITFPFLNFNGATVNVKEYVITYPCWKLKLIPVSNGTHVYSFASFTCHQTITSEIQPPGAFKYFVLIMDLMIGFPQEEITQHSVQKVSDQLREQTSDSAALNVDDIENSVEIMDHIVTNLTSIQQEVSYWLKISNHRVYY